MQTRTALRRMTGGDINYNWGDGPLGKVADQLVEAFQIREANRLEDAEVRASMMGTGPMLAALQRRFAEVEQQSMFDAAMPMCTRFDAYQLLTDASRTYTADRGLKLAAAHAKELWMREPDGVLAVGDVMRMRAHWSREYPKSKIASVLDNELPKVGFNTLPVPKLAQLASNIRGQDEAELRASYETVVRAHGLDGDRPDQIRARAYLCGLVNLAVDDTPAGGMQVEAGGDAAADRTLRRMAAYDDPILRSVGQFMPGEPDMGEDPAETGMSLEPHEDEIPHEEGGGAIVETESPITGEPMVLELELPSGEGEGEGEGMDEPEALDVTPDDVEGLPHFGQLDDFAGLDDEEESDPMAMGDVPAVDEGSGSSTVTIEDPTAPGEMLEVTIEPAGGGEGSSALPAVPVDMPLEGEGGHIAGLHTAVAPPGHEKQVKKLKKDPDVDNPWAVAWSSHNKEKGKAHKRAFAVYAIRGGVKAEQPLERVMAESMSRVLAHVAKSLREAGGVDYEVRAPAEQFQNRALIVLDAAAGNHLYVVAEDKAKSSPHAGPEEGSEFNPEISGQPGDAVPSMVKGDGGKTLKAAAPGRPWNRPMPGDDAYDEHESLRQEMVEQREREMLKGPGGQLYNPFGADWIDDPEEAPSDFQREVMYQQERGVDPLETVFPEGGYSIEDPNEDLRREFPDLEASKAARRAAPMDKAQVAAFVEEKLGLTASKVEATILNAEPARLTVGREEKLRLEVNASGNVELKVAGRVVKTAGLEALDGLIEDYLARAAVVYQQMGSARVAGVAGVAPRATYEVHPLFLVGCAQCGRMDEYLMPKTASSVRCGTCSYETPAAAVAVQMNARQAKAFPGYVVLTDVPGDGQLVEMNARRMMAEIMRVVPTATGQILPEGRLEVQLRPVNDSALARIRNVLESKFGCQQLVTKEARTAQQEMQSTLPGAVSNLNVNQAVSPTYQKPAVPETPPIGGGLPAGGGTSVNVEAPSAQPGVGGAAPLTPAAPAATGAGSQQKFMQEHSASRTPVWDVAYQLDGQVLHQKVEAANEQTARRIFAMYDADAVVMNVRRAQAAPAAAPEPAPAPGGAPGGEPAPAASEAGDAAASMGTPQMTPAVQEAIKAAMMTLRNSGIDIASAIDEFGSQFKQFLERFGDKTAPARQAIGAEIVRAAQEAWSKPALLDLTAARNALERAAAGMNPGKIAPQQGKDRVSVPKAPKVLGPDSSTNEPKVMSPGKIKTQQGKPSGKLSPKELGPDSSSREAPWTMNPPADGSYGLVGKGTDTTPTDLGEDSQNQENATTRHWDSVSSQAPGTVRSKGKAGPAPTKRGSAMQRLASLNLANARPQSDATAWAVEAIRRAKAGEFPEDELWAARDAGLEQVLQAGRVPNAVKAALEEALAAL